MHATQPPTLLERKQAAVENVISAIEEQYNGAVNDKVAAVKDAVQTRISAAQDAVQSKVAAVSEALMGGSKRLLADDESDSKTSDVKPEDKSTADTAGAKQEDKEEKEVGLGCALDCVWAVLCFVFCGRDCVQLPASRWACPTRSTSPQPQDPCALFSLHAVQSCKQCNARLDLQQLFTQLPFVLPPIALLWFAKQRPALTLR